jgi:hypothetical protein
MIYLTLILVLRFIDRHYNGSVGGNGQTGGVETLPESSMFQLTETSLLRPKEMSRLAVMC